MQTAAEVEAMIAAVADGTVTLDGASTPYSEDLADELFHGNPGQTVGEVRTILVATGKLPTLAIGSFPTVDGTRMRARDVRREGDGRVTRIYLGELA